MKGSPILPIASLSPTFLLWKQCIDLFFNDSYLLCISILQYPWPYILAKASQYWHSSMISGWVVTMLKWSNRRDTFYNSNSEQQWLGKATNEFIKNETLCHYGKRCYNRGYIYILKTLFMLLMQSPYCWILMSDTIYHLNKLIWPNRTF